jgi:polyhydroxyalkanoate synthesis regulator phasin
MADLDKDFDSILQGDLSSLQEQEAVTDLQLSPNVSVIDADTYETTVNGQLTRVRLPGIDAVETQHGIGGGRDYKGKEINDKIINLYKKRGFINPIVSEQLDETESRFIGDLQDDKGNTATDYLLYNQLVTPTIHATPEQVNTYVVGSLDRAMRKISGKITPEDELANNVFESIGAQGFRVKPLALTEEEFAAAAEEAPGFYRGVALRDYDRTIMNEAASTMATGLRMGTLGIAEGAYGALELFGDIFNADGLSKYGKAHGERIRRELEDLPYLKNQSAFDEDGNWNLHGIGETANFIYSNMMASAPYLAMSVTAALAGAIPLIGMGLAVGAPASVFAGQIYRDQEEKNPLAAIGGGLGMSVIDRLGLKALAGRTSPDIFRSNIREKIVDAFLVKNPHIKSREMAETFVALQLKKASEELNSTVKSQIAQEIAYKQLLKSTPVAFAQGAVSEGLTESAQEIIQYTAAQTPESFDVNKMTEAALNGLVAGAALGGSFRTVGNAGQFVQARDQIRGQALREKPLSFDMEIQEDERKNSGGKLRSVTEVTEDLDKAAAASQNDETIADFAPEEGRTAGQKVKDYFKTQGIVRGLLGQSLRAVGRPYAKIRGKNGSTIVRDIFSSLGAFKVNGSDTDEVYNQEREAFQMSFLETEEEAIQSFEVKNTQEVSDIIYDSEVQLFLNSVFISARNNKDKTFKKAAESVRKLKGKYSDKQDAIIKFAEGVFNLERQRNLPSGTLLKTKVLDKGKVAKNREKFISLLMQRDLSPDAAKAATELFIDTVDATTIKDLVAEDLSMMAGDTANSAALKELATSELQLDPEAFSEFFADNVFFNLFSDISRSAASETYGRFFGENGKKLVGALKQAVAEGEISEEQAKDIAYQLKDYMKVRTGQLGRIQNERLRRTQDNLLLLTTLNSLPLATVSSLVETALITRMLTKGQIFDMLQGAGKNLALELGNYINELTSKVGLTQRKDYVKGDRVNLKDLGFLLQGQSSKQRSGLNPESAFTNRVLDGFFKGIGLQGLTNFLRTLRLSVAGDAINGFLDIVDGSRSWQNDTLEVQEARQALIDLNINPDELNSLRKKVKRLEQDLARLGVDPEKLVEGELEGDFSANPVVQEYLRVKNERDRLMRTGSINFVDIAVANPRAYNRPFFYANKKLAMLTSFQGFISAFTATILPNIYKGLIARKVSTNIDSVRTIALLITLGFAAQYLRDMIKYGETPEWIDDDEKLQRAIYSSGLLGSTERIVDMAMPLYPQRSDGILDGAYNFAEGEMPALNWVGRVGKAFGEAYQGDPGSAAKYAYRALPIVGPDYAGGKRIESAIDKYMEGES